MKKKLIYRKSTKGVSEQYGINISKKIIEDMNITPNDREVEITYDDKKKTIQIIKNLKFCTS